MMYTEAEVFVANSPCCEWARTLGYLKLVTHETWLNSEKGGTKGTSSLTGYENL